MDVAPSAPRSRKVLLAALILLAEGMVTAGALDASRALGLVVAGLCVALWALLLFVEVP